MINVAAALSHAGITIRECSDGNHKAICPKCSANRKPANRRDLCLSITVTDDGVVWRCHNCDWSTPTAEDDPEFYAVLHGREQRRESSRPAARLTREAPRRPTVEPTDMIAQGYRWFEARGISRPTVDHAGLFVMRTWMPGADGKVECLAFPYKWDGEVINVKYRDIATKRFRQEKGAAKVFYGLDTIGTHEVVVIVEGEIDALSLIEAGTAERMGVLSVPDGAPAKVRDDMPAPEDDAKFAYVWNCRKQLASVKKIILAVDADGPGRALEEELARRLGKERCWRVSWPTINDALRKDANEVLMEDGPEVLRECMDAAKPYPVKSLHGAMDFRDRVMAVYEGGRSRGHSTGWPGLDRHYTVVPGQFTVVTGMPGSGKSEFIDALMVNLAVAAGWGFAVCSFENDPAEDHIPKLAEKFLGMPFFDGPTPRMGTGDLDRAVEWIDKHFHFIVSDDEAPTVDWILEKARAAVVRHGVRGLVIDPYNEVEHRRPNTMSETEYVSQLIGKCKRFARLHGAHIWFVAHPAKMLRQDGKLQVPTLYDISGSANWVNKADIGIVVHREWDTVSGAPSFQAQIHIKKIRHRWVGKPGLVKLDYDPKTGNYTEPAPSVSPRQPYVA